MLNLGSNPNHLEYLLESNPKHWDYLFEGNPKHWDYLLVGNPKHWDYLLEGNPKRLIYLAGGRSQGWALLIIRNAPIVPFQSIIILPNMLSPPRKDIGQNVRETLDSDQYLQSLKL